MNKRVITVGEIMMRLTPKDNLKISQTNELEICFGGAEVNVAIGLQHLGVDSAVITAVPNNEIGHSAKAFLKSHDINCDSVVVKGERLGLYYYEEGCSLRNGNVIYDRKHSSITDIEIEDIDLESTFKDVEILHISGITLGLGSGVRKFVCELVSYAKSIGVKISVDLNYRAKLFSGYEEFAEVMKPIVEDSYICFGWLNRDVNNFKVLDGSRDGITDELLINNFKYMTEDLGVKYVATTLRVGSSVNYNSLTGLIYDGKNLVRSSKYEFSMISRIGGGDAFAAGVIRMLLEEGNNLEVIEFGTACAALKHSIKGDVSLSSYEEVYDTTGRKNLGSVNR
ncbi:sugar kinase [Clostridium gasigenes]|uniref:sugar kinase n=1 Tax=Clostridium gasigenes TaxID=94869 RepID=UPI0014386D23|nr:sugar kinase [Clostridium gasigenes]NKF05896.1 sugar kinase [Clostridium gasigenes]QSW19375.1 sugar kinase [Clostridium gasigenes]